MATASVKNENFAILRQSCTAGKVVYILIKFYIFPFFYLPQPHQDRAWHATSQSWQIAHERWADSTSFIFRQGLAPQPTSELDTGPADADGLGVRQVSCRRIVCLSPAFLSLIVELWSSPYTWIQHNLQFKLQ